MKDLIFVLIGFFIGIIITLCFEDIKENHKENFEDEVRCQVRKVLDDYGIEPKGKLKTHYVKDF